MGFFQNGPNHFLNDFSGQPLEGPPSPHAINMYSLCGMQNKVIDTLCFSGMEQGLSGPRRPTDGTESDDDDEDTESSSACLPEKCYQCEPPRCPTCPPCPCKRECKFGFDSRRNTQNFGMHPPKENKRKRGTKVLANRRPETFSNMEYKNKAFKERPCYNKLGSNGFGRRSMPERKFHSAWPKSRKISIDFYDKPRYVDRDDKYNESSSDESSELELDMSSDDPCPSRIVAEPCPPRRCRDNLHLSDDSEMETSTGFNVFYEMFKKKNPQLSKLCTLAKARMIYNNFNLKEDKKLRNLIINLDSEYKIPLLRSLGKDE